MSGLEPDERLRVRPYAMTGGRTRAQMDLAIETLVLATPKGRDGVGQLAFEQSQIVQLATSPMSIAEVSARLGVVLGVVRILVADLLATDMLESRAGRVQSSTDVSLLERVVDGLKAL